MRLVLPVVNATFWIGCDITQFGRLPAFCITDTVCPIETS